MRRRIKPAPSQGGAFRVLPIVVDSAVRLVTLEDPTSGLRLAQDAFVRLRPPAGLESGAIDTWRWQVAKVARAVKVLPVHRAAKVPAASHRPERKVGSIREEALKLAEETEKSDVIKLVTSILDEVGA